MTMSSSPVVNLHANPQAAAVAATSATPAAATSVQRLHPSPTPPLAHRAFVPLLLIGLTLLCGAAALTFDAYNQRLALQAAHSQQQQTVDSAGQLRQQLDKLAADTQRLADAGNASAAVLVTELRKRGITIQVPASGSAGAGAGVGAAAAAKSQAPQQ